MPTWVAYGKIIGKQYTLAEKTSQTRRRPDKWFTGGEVFRSDCCFHRSKGKVFNFRPGHESFPIYHMPLVHQILKNAVRWAAPVKSAPTTVNLVEPLEKLAIG